MGATHRSLSRPRELSAVVAGVVLVIATCIVAMTSVTRNADAAILVNGVDPGGRIAAGANHTCAIAQDDTVWCWGDNAVGQLGNTDFTLNSADSFSVNPIQVDASWGVKVPHHIAAGVKHTCLLTQDGTVWCWGDNGFGELGSNSSDPNAPSVVSLGNTATAISAGGNNTCALLVDRSVQCWGKNNRGQLGNSSTPDTNPHYLPSTVSLTDASAQSFAVTHLEVGENHVCAGESNGALRCWGQFNYGRLGTNTSSNAVSPAGTAALGGTASQVSAGGSHTCAVVTVSGAQRLTCFGNNASGQIAQASSTTENSTPTLVSLANNAVSVSTGTSHTCVLEANNTVECFGANDVGQLGRNTGAASQFAAGAVSGLTGDVVDIISGSNHTCVVMATGEVKCWGSNSQGQLGRAKTTTSSYTPQTVGTLNVVPTTTTTTTTTTTSTSTTTSTTTTTTTVVNIVPSQQNSTTTSTTLASTTTTPNTTTTTTSVPHYVSSYIRKGVALSAAKIAASVGLKIPKQSQGSMRIAITSGKNNCRFVGTTIKGVKKGTCTVLVVLIPKKGNTTERKLIISVK